MANESFGSSPRMSERARRYVEAKHLKDAARAQEEQRKQQQRARYGGLYHNAPARGFTKAVLVCLTKFIRFSGRASRSEYWYFMLFQLLAGIAMVIVDVTIFGADLRRDDTGPASSILALILFLPVLAVTWRRLHDTGKSGWWIGAPPLVLILLGVAAPFALSSSALPFPGFEVFVVLGIVYLGYALLILVFLCTRGDPGPNRFG